MAKHRYTDHDASRLALQLVCQLPENVDDARLVVSWTGKLLEAIQQLPGSPFPAEVQCGGRGRSSSVMIGSPERHAPCGRLKIHAAWMLEKKSSLRRNALRFTLPQSPPAMLPAWGGIANSATGWRRRIGRSRWSRCATSARAEESGSDFRQRRGWKRVKSHRPANSDLRRPTSGLFDALGSRPAPVRP